MLKISVRIDTKGLQQSIEKELDRLPSVIHAATIKAVQDLQPLRDEFAKSVGAVKRPIEWTSEKQRKAFFATDGFGAGIPYKRTGKLQAGWGLLAVQNLDGSTLILQNMAEAAKYVYGFFGQRRPQQQFHRNTGWQTVKKTQDKTVRKMIDALIDNLQEEWSSSA